MIIKKLIKTNLKIPCYFINYKNKTFHRIIVILNISKKDFVNFDNLLYEYIEMNNLNIVQTTIEKAPYEVLNINQKFKNYNNLKYKTLYFNELVNLLGLAVAKNYRRQGVATELIKHVEHWARDNGIKMIRLNSGSSRKEAHEFYRKLGFDNEKEQIRFMKSLK